MAKIFETRILACFAKICTRKNYQPCGMYVCMYVCMHVCIYACMFQEHISTGSSSKCVTWNRSEFIANIKSSNKYYGYMLHTRRLKSHYCMLSMWPGVLFLYDSIVMTGRWAFIGVTRSYSRGPFLYALDVLKEHSLPMFCPISCIGSKFTLMSTHPVVSFA